MKHGSRYSYQRGCRCELCVDIYNSYQRAWDKANADRRALHKARYREKNREKLHEYNKRYREENGDKQRATKARWRALQKNAPGSHTAAEFNNLKSKYGNRCIRCGIHETFVGTLHRDHIVPLSKGGYDSIDNLQPLCRDCNTRKGTTIKDWRKETIADEK